MIFSNDTIFLILYDFYVFYRWTRYNWLLKNFLIFIWLRFGTKIFLILNNQSILKHQLFCFKINNRVWYHGSIFPLLRGRNWILLKLFFLKSFKLNSFEGMLWKRWAAGVRVILISCVCVYFHIWGELTELIFISCIINIYILRRNWHFLKLILVDVLCFIIFTFFWVGWINWLNDLIGL